MGKKRIPESELIIVDGRIYHLGLKPNEIAKQVFLVGDPGRVEKVAKKFTKIRYEAQNREFITVTGEYRDMPISVVSTGIGTDNTNIAVTELDALVNINFRTRTKKYKPKSMIMIRLGTSGGPQEDIEEGTMGISKFGLGLDNTGRYQEVKLRNRDNYYLIKSLEYTAEEIIRKGMKKSSRNYGKIFPYASIADPDVVKALETAAKRRKIKYVTGITASASGFFEQQGRYIRIKPSVLDLQERLALWSTGEGYRVVNFEMETSQLFHMAYALKHKAGTICPIIANRPKGTFVDDEGHERCIEDCIRIGLGAMLSLYKSKDKK